VVSAEEKEDEKIKQGDRMTVKNYDGEKLW